MLEVFTLATELFKDTVSSAFETVGGNEDNTVVIIASVLKKAQENVEDARVRL